MNNRSIIRSTKNAHCDTNFKKVQVKLGSSGNIHEHQQNTYDRRAEKQNLSQTGRSKKSDCSGEAKNDGKMLGWQLCEGKEKKILVYKSCTLIKSCLKKQSYEERKPSLEGSEELEGEVKSSRSIKFNFNNPDVFIYSHGDNRKKVKLPTSAKKIIPPKIKTDQVDGQCCQIY